MVGQQNKHFYSCSKRNGKIKFCAKKTRCNIMNILTKTNTAVHQKQGSAESCSSNESSLNLSRGAVGTDVD